MFLKKELMFTSLSIVIGVWAEQVGMGCSSKAKIFIPVAMRRDDVTVASIDRSPHGHSP